MGEVDGKIGIRISAVEGSGNGSEVLDADNGGGGEHAGGNSRFDSGVLGRLLHRIVDLRGH